MSTIEFALHTSPGLKHHATRLIGCFTSTWMENVYCYWTGTSMKRIEWAALNHRVRSLWPITNVWARPIVSQHCFVSSFVIAYLRLLSVVCQLWLCTQLSSSCFYYHRHHHHHQHNVDVKNRHSKFVPHVECCDHIVGYCWGLLVSLCELRHSCDVSLCCDTHTTCVKFCKAQRVVFLSHCMLWQSQKQGNETKQGETHLNHHNAGK